jgi:hypothetical protein
MGSLMVEDVATNPRAIGLLFADSSTDAIANRSSAELSRRDHGRPVGARRFTIQVPVRRQANGRFLLFPLPISKLPVWERTTHNLFRRRRLHLGRRLLVLFRRNTGLWPVRPAGL